MKEDIKKMLDCALAGKMVEAEETFHQIMATKALNSIADYKRDVGQRFFNKAGGDE